MGRLLLGRNVTTLDRLGLESKHVWILCWLFQLFSLNHQGIPMIPGPWKQRSGLGFWSSISSYSFVWDHVRRWPFASWQKTNMFTSVMGDWVASYSNSQCWCHRCPLRRYDNATAFCLRSASPSSQWRRLEWNSGWLINQFYGPDWSMCNLFATYLDSLRCFHYGIPDICRFRLGWLQFSSMTPSQIEITIRRLIQCGAPKDSCLH